MYYLAMSAPGGVELDEGVSLLDVAFEGLVVQGVEALLRNSGLGLSNSLLDRQKKTNFENKHSANILFFK